MLGTFWEEPNQRNTDNNTSYDDTPKYVVDVVGGAVSKTYRRLPESRNHRQIILACPSNVYGFWSLFRVSFSVGTPQQASLPIPSTGTLPSSDLYPVLICDILSSYNF